LTHLNGYFSLSKAAKTLGNIAKFAMGFDAAEWAADNPRAAVAIAISLASVYYAQTVAGILEK